MLYSAGEHPAAVTRTEKPFGKQNGAYEVRVVLPFATNAPAENQNSRWVFSWTNPPDSRTVAGKNSICPLRLICMSVCSSLACWCSVARGKPAELYLLVSTIPESSSGIRKSCRVQCDESVTGIRSGQSELA